MQHTTLASEAPCLHCRAPLLYAWDEGVLVRADRAPLAVSAAYRAIGRGREVYVLTHGGNLIREDARRLGTLRLMRSRHLAHDCPRRPAAPAGENQQLELFGPGTVRPPAQTGGLW